MVLRESHCNGKQISFSHASSCSVDAIFYLLLNGLIGSEAEEGGSHGQTFSGVVVKEKTLCWWCCCCLALSESLWFWVHLWSESISIISVQNKRRQSVWEPALSCLSFHNHPLQLNLENMAHLMSPLYAQHNIYPILMIHYLVSGSYSSGESINECTLEKQIHSFIWCANWK